jgi:predicted nucleic acid-binding protein
MLRVVDASVVVKWFIWEPHRDKAMELLAGFRGKSLDLTAPDLVVAEVASALWKRSAKTKEISELEATESHADFLALGLKFHPIAPLVGAALRLALQETTLPTTCFTWR